MGCVIIDSHSKGHAAQEIIDIYIRETEAIRCPHERTYSDRMRIRSNRIGGIHIECAFDQNDFHQLKLIHLRRQIQIQFIQLCLERMKGM